MAFSLTKLLAGDLGKDWFNKFNGNIDLQVQQEATRDTQVANLQSQVNTLVQAIGGITPGAYTPPTDASTFTYSTAAAAWTKAKSLGVATFGPVYNGNTAPQVGGPTIGVLPWSTSQKSMLVGWTAAAATYNQTMNQLTQFGYVRRVALDANGAPSISSADVALPYSINTQANQNTPTLASLVSGVAVSDGVFKGISFDYVYSNSGQVSWQNVRRYGAAWDGSNFTVSNEGNYSSGYNGNSGGLVISYSYSGNSFMQLNGVSGVLNSGLLNYDVNQLDRGVNTDVSFGGYRVPVTWSPYIHDFAGAGRIVTPYLTTTHNDPTSRLTLTVETRDDTNGIAQTASYRIPSKGSPSGVPSLFCLSNTLFIVQWVDGNGNRWAVALTYNPTTNVLAQFGNNFYSAGNLGSYPLQWLTMFSATVAYALRKDTASALAARLMKIVFDTTQPSGQELTSATASDIVFSVCSTVANASAVTIMGMFRMPGDIVVIYGRVAVTANSATTYYGFVESFQLS